MQGNVDVASNLNRTKLKIKYRHHILINSSLGSIHKRFIKDITQIWKNWYSFLCPGPYALAVFMCISFSCCSKWQYLQDAMHAFCKKIFLESTSPKKFQTILFCQSWDNWGQNLLQTHRQILWHHIRVRVDFFFKLNLLPPYSLR